MRKLLIRRSLGMFITLNVIIILVWVMMVNVPGGPFSREKTLPPETVQQLEEKYGVGRPLPEMIWTYMVNLYTRLDFGPSLQNKDFSVGQRLQAAFPNSLILGGIAMVVALSLGLLAGALGALNQNKWQDNLLMGISTIGITTPLFVIGPVLMLIFATYLGWLPLGGWFRERGPVALVLPVITLSLPYFANIARLFRASMLDVLQSDYIRTARAKGLSVPVIIMKHCLKPALIPVISYVGPAFAAIITGSVVVESIFVIPGIGGPFVTSSINRDYFMILGTVIAYFVVLIIMNLIADMLLGFLDPRIKDD
jgi:oligopeptide transport system permease protein